MTKATDAAQPAVEAHGAQSSREQAQLLEPAVPVERQRGDHRQHFIHEVGAQAVPLLGRGSVASSLEKRTDSSTIAVTSASTCS